MATTAARDLFDPAFLRSLEGLRILARRLPAGGRHGEQRSRARGGGVEFTDVRGYAPGDDYRAIDWHLYQRFGKLFLRLFLEEQDLPLYLLLDQSASMQMVRRGETTKSRTARQAVAALAYVALNHTDRVSVYPFADRSLRPLRNLSGKHAFHRLLAFLAALPALGRTGLVEALERFGARKQRQGLCVVVTDCFDPLGPDAVLEALARLPHELLLLRPVHQGEERPRLSGPLQLLDCETGESLALTLDETALARYRKAYADFAATLQTFATRRGGRCLSLRCDLPTVTQLATLFPGGVLRP